MLALLGRNEAEEEKVIEGVNECNMSAMLNVPKVKEVGRQAEMILTTLTEWWGILFWKGLELNTYLKSK